jgi:hypothetical protein
MAGTYSFWFLAISSILALITVLIKLKWWEYSLGYWLLLLTGILVFLCGFIFLLRTGILPEAIRNEAQFIIYGTLGIAVCLLIIDIWRKNLRHWAWTKEE